MAKADRDKRGTWEKGDLIWLKEGEGEPLISEQQLDELLARNKAADKAAKPPRKGSLLSHLRRRK